MNENEKLEFELCPFCGGEVSIATEKYGIMFMCRCCLITFSFHDVKDLEEAVERFNRRIQLDWTDGWISVEDRLPKERHYPPVICGHINDDWTDAAIVTDIGKWINSEGCEIFPTHWMPLPQPPKEGRV